MKEQRGQTSLKKKVRTTKNLKPDGTPAEVRYVETDQVWELSSGKTDATVFAYLNIGRNILTVWDATSWLPDFESDYVDFAEHSSPDQEASAANFVAENRIEDIDYAFRDLLPSGDMENSDLLKDFYIWNVSKGLTTNTTAQIFEDPGVTFVENSASIEEEDDAEKRIRELEHQLGVLKAEVGLVKEAVQSLLNAR